MEITTEKLDRLIKKAQKEIRAISDDFVFKCGANTGINVLATTIIKEMGKELTKELNKEGK